MRLASACESGHEVTAGRFRTSSEHRTDSQSMLAEIKQLLADLYAGGKQSGHFDADDCRVAAAALMVHVATLEHDLTGPARHRLADLLKSRFSLTDALTAELVEAAVAADREAVDFYHFTQLLMRALDEQGRLRVVEMLWEMAFADGTISEFEDNMMWRVADLLAVSPHDRIALRQRVAGQPAVPEVNEMAGNGPDEAGA
jgi:uncharacterized tellurite resistance protein B-like protein